MDFWNHLINTALLGTGKQTIDISLLPESIQPVLTNPTDADPETQLLRTGALVVLYLQAGTGAEKLDLPPTPVCDAETQAYGPPAAVRIAKKLLHTDQKPTALLEYWLDKCRVNGWIAPPELLVDLLNAGVEKKHLFLQTKIRQVAGKRGLWLAQFNPAWQYLPEPDYRMHWEEGKSTERKEAFGQLRRQDPDQARTLLQTSWPTESARDKAELLKLLSIRLSRADEPLLEQFFDELERAGDKQKPASMAIRKELVKLLLRLPESRLSREIWENVKRYFHPQQERGILQLPAGEDDFFNAAYMTGRLALTEPTDNAHPAHNVQHWMHELITFIPPFRWTQVFPGSRTDLFESWFTGLPQGPNQQTTDPAYYIIALAKAIHRFSDADWASQWVRFFKIRYKLATRDVESLYHYLPQSDLEDFYQHHIGDEWRSSSRTALRDVITHDRLQQWSLDFTRFIMKGLTNAMADHYQTGEARNFVEGAIRFIHPAIVPLLADLPAADTTEWQKQQWQIQIVTPLTRMLAIRQEIDKL